MDRWHSVHIHLSRRLPGEVPILKVRAEACGNAGDSVRLATRRHRRRTRALGWAEPEPNSFRNCRISFRPRGQNQWRGAELNNRF
jgi:hypothetical protein